MKIWTYYIIGLLLIFLLTTCATSDYPTRTALLDTGELIDESNIPGKNFRNFLKYTLSLVTLEDCQRVVILTVESKDITDITGIRYFTALKELHLAQNNLTTVPRTLPSLKDLQYLDLRGNNLDAATITWLKDTYIYTNDYPNFALYIDQ